MVGRFIIPDMFDTNKYANNPKSDFLNWLANNAGTFDFAGDAWGAPYGAAAEWYKGRFTLRGGVFDMTTTPAGAESPDGVVNDPTFGQFELVGEAEERHELWGQPGKLKLLGYLIGGRMGAYSDAIAYINNNPGAAPGSAMQSVRRWNTRPGASLNLEQQVTADVGVFARAGWGTARSRFTILPISTGPCWAVFPCRAIYGAGATTPLASRASSTASPGNTRLI